ncbi:hypothetical protein BK144_26640 [Paenibacillus sp. FSL R7-0273]|nr:hypothetical protein BK144_26640 [Paenibacillus sp. FSL R7-0273]
MPESKLSKLQSKMLQLAPVYSGLLSQRQTAEMKGKNAFDSSRTGQTAEMRGKNALDSSRYEQKAGMRGKNASEFSRYEPKRSKGRNERQKCL